MRDIAPLASLKELKSLLLCGVPIKDVKPIASLRQLRTLDVSKTNVTDLARLADLPHLERLAARRAGLTSFASLSRLTKLKYLSASAQTDGDLRPLASLVHLEDLELTGRNVTDLGPLPRMQNLKELGLWDTGVTDLSPLAECRSLETLDLGDTLIETVEPLRDLPRLSTIDVSFCPRLVSIAPLARCPQLETVTAGECDALSGPTTIEQLGGAPEFDVRNHLPRTPPPGWTLPECDGNANIATIEASLDPAPELAVKNVVTLMPTSRLDEDTLLVYLLRRDEQWVDDATARQLLPHFRACDDFTERHDDESPLNRNARGFAARAHRARRMTWGKYEVHEPELSVPACPDPGPPRPDAVFDLRHHLPDPVPDDWEAFPTKDEDGVRFHTQECTVVVVLGTTGDIYKLTVALLPHTGVRLADEVAHGLLGRFRAHAGLEETPFGPSTEAPGVRVFKGLARPM